MKTNLFVAGALAAALVAPIAVSAQQTQAPSTGRYSQSRTMPSAAKMQHRWAKRLGRLNLSGQQQQRVQSIINQFSQTHPEGSVRDRGAYRELRRQLMGVLSSEQQNQLRQMRSHHSQHRGQSQSGGGQGYEQYAPQEQRYAQPGQQYGQPPQYGQPQYEQPQGQYGPQGAQYGPQGAQYGPQGPQYGPEGQQYGPQGQQYGPPGQQYQQGPPMDEQGPPQDGDDQQGPT